MISPNHDVNPNNLLVTPSATGPGGNVQSVWDLPEGNGTTLGAQLSNLTNGALYINVHSAGHGGGEIRGQIQAIPVPAAAGMGIGLLSAWGAWRAYCRRGRRFAT